MRARQEGALGPKCPGDVRAARGHFVPKTLGGSATGGRFGHVMPGPEETSHIFRAGNAFPGLPVRHRAVAGTEFVTEHPAPDAAALPRFLDRGRERPRPSDCGYNHATSPPHIPANGRVVDEDADFADVDSPAEFTNPALHGDSTAAATVHKELNQLAHTIACAYCDLELIERTLRESEPFSPARPRRARAGRPRAERNAGARGVRIGQCGHDLLPRTQSPHLSGVSPSRGVPGRPGSPARGGCRSRWAPGRACRRCWRCSC